MPDPFQRFDGAALWARLPADQQAELGTIVLEIGVTLRLLDSVVCRDGSRTGRSRVIARVAEAAMQSLDALLHSAVAVVVPAEVLAAQDTVAPYLPSLLGGVCRDCGCTQNDACAPSCSWVAEDLCSACAPAEAAHG